MKKKYEAPQAELYNSRFGTFLAEGDSGDLMQNDPYNDGYGSSF